MCFASCKSLSLIESFAPIAPNLTGHPFGMDALSTGRNTYNTGKNMLFVPVDAIGYEDGDWASHLCNANHSGFTLSKTL